MRKKLREKVGKSESGRAENGNKKKFLKSHLLIQMKKTSDKKEKNKEDLMVLMYVLSHDLQEPLRKIKNFVSGLLNAEKEKLSVDGKRYLEKTYENTEQMQTLIEDLVKYFHARISRIFEKTDLYTILNEVKKDFEKIINEKKIILKIERPCKVNIIRFQFRQLIQNLISNSLKFSKPHSRLCIVIKSKIVPGSKLNNEKSAFANAPAGGLNLSLDQSSTTSGEGSYCHITYTDNGIGFDPQYNERIFELFQRIHSKEEYQGTGTGLAICKRIIENHNGIITATGTLNKGARFDIYFPV